MILKIPKLERFGIYKNFTWGTLDDFKDRNLVYGWNYSGKTTLSKLFQNLETSKIEKYFNTSSFKIEFKDLSDSIKSIDENSIDDFPFIVKVFNSNYQERIFTWNDPKNGIDPISFYLGDPAGNITKQIESLEEKNSRLTIIKDIRYLKIKNEFEKYSKANGLFSDQAKTIREEYLPRLLQASEFNKAHFEQIVNSVKDDYNKHILDAKIKDETRNSALAKNVYDIVEEEIDYPQNLSNLIKSVKSILEEKAPKTISFPELDEDQDLFDWVQKGIPLHKDEEECKFCTKPLPDDRIENLNFYYSKKLQEIQDSIKSARELIELELKDLEVKFPDKSAIGENLRKKYELAIENYNTNSSEYKSSLKTLEKDIDRKEKSMFVNIDSSDVTIVELKESIDSIIEIIKEHNSWVNEFDKRKAKASEEILEHYVSDFIKKENYVEKESQYNDVLQSISKIDILLSKNLQDISSLRAQLSTKVKGKEELNLSLQILLNRDDIKIEISNERFILERSGHPATSLSEGEKSAIAFSYFLTELKSLKQSNQLEKTIVFIDDPISSLDSNHIFQVRSLIQSFFKKDSCRQLFIATHNFEFLSVLLDTNMFGPRNKETGESKRPFYFIQREANHAATIKKLPKAFSSYKSEYVGIFKIIQEFNSSNDKENFPHLIILPNAVRRFVELYTLMKYPSEKEIDHRVKSVFESDQGTYHTTKLLHWFSHQNQVEKVRNHDDKILQLEGAVDELLSHIEQKDPLHWKGLTEF